MEPLVRELHDVLGRVRRAGLKLFIHDDDGMRYTPVIAATEEEARKKVMKHKGQDGWDEENESLIEISGDAI